MIDAIQALGRCNSPVENIGGDNVLQVVEELNPLGINNVKKRLTSFGIQRNLLIRAVELKLLLMAHNGDNLL